MLVPMSALQNTQFQLHEHAVSNQEKQRELNNVKAALWQKQAALADAERGLEVQAHKNSMICKLRDRLEAMTTRSEGFEEEINRIKQRQVEEIRALTDELNEARDTEKQMEWHFHRFKVVLEELDSGGLEEKPQAQRLKNEIRFFLSNARFGRLRCSSPLNPDVPFSEA